MKRYNVIAVYDPAEKNLLMCRRAKEPYKGMLNFAGGKIEPSETSDAARFAGECNIDHILRQVDSYNREALK